MYAAAISAGISGISQVLNAMFSAGTGESSFAATSTTQTLSTSCDSTTNLTGSGKAQLSSQILGLLAALQADPSSETDAGTNGGNPAQSPLDQLFTAMDSDGNGSVSQSEMESYIENLGGTQGEADALYSAIGQSGNTAANTSGLSESQFAEALRNGQMGRMHGHRHHHDGMANNLIDAIDGNNGSDSIDQSQLESFFTQNGGTASQADSDFAALDTDGSGSVSPSELLNAIRQYQASLSGSNAVNFLDALAQNASAAASASS